MMINLPKNVKKQLAKIPVLVWMLRIPIKITTYFNRGKIVKVNGYKLRLDDRDSLNISFYPMYEEGISKWIMENVKKDWVCLDLGANIGYHTMLMSQRCKKVYAFEPSTSNFKVLDENIKINKFDNVLSCKYAVCNDNKDFMLYTAPGKEHGSPTITEKFVSDHSHSELIVGVKLDTFFNKDFKIDFLKMDIEGAEPDAVKGMKHIIESNPQMKMIIEFVPFNGDVEKYHEMYDYFAKNYTVWDMDNEKWMKEFNAKASTNILLVRKHD